LFATKYLIYLDESKKNFKKCLKAKIIVKGLTFKFFKPRFGIETFWNFYPVAIYGNKK